MVGVPQVGLVEIVLSPDSGVSQLAEVRPSCPDMNFPCVLCKVSYFGLESVPLPEALSASGGACVEFCKSVGGEFDHFQEVKCSVWERFDGVSFAAPRTPLIL